MKTDAARKIAIVSPVFNDWDAFGKLIERIGQLEEVRNNEVHVIAVDDCSSEPPDAGSLNARKGYLNSVRVARLACNLGPMRAIAAGLVSASKLPGIEAVIVMDADGEDRPDYIGQFIATWNEQPNRIVVGKRTERSEGWIFKLFYSAYKMIFKGLTGQSITFGSFSLLPRTALQALVHNPAIWNNLPAAIIRSRLPYIELETKRGTRLAGRPRMNFVNLAVHGISAISVYTDVLLLRIIIAASIFATAVFLGIVAVVIIRIATDWAIPGWATYLGVSLMIILLQTLVFAGFALFQLLSLRNLKAFVPASDVASFMLDEDADGSEARAERPARAST